MGSYVQGDDARSGVSGGLEQLGREKRLYEALIEIALSCTPACSWSDVRTGEEG